MSAGGRSTLVCCPVCARSVPSVRVQAHVEECLRKPARPQAPKSRPGARAHPKRDTHVIPPAGRQPSTRISAHACTVESQHVLGTVRARECASVLRRSQWALRKPLAPTPAQQRRALPWTTYKALIIQETLRINHSF